MAAYQVILANTVPIVFQLEKGGKASGAGLYVGDVMYSINGVVLTGSRNEAVQMVKASGNTLTVGIERFVYLSMPM